VPLLPCADGSLTAPAGHARLRRAQLRSDRPPGRLEAQGDPKDKGPLPHRHALAPYPLRGWSASTKRTVL